MRTWKRVEPIPGFASQRPLGGGGGGDRRRDGGKDGAEGIADRLEDEAAVRLDRRAQQCVVAGEGDRHRPRLALPEPGAALDVGEEEGYGLRRTFRHGILTFTDA